MSPSVERNCQTCGAIFRAFASKVAQGFGKFCGESCYYAWRRGRRSTDAQTQARKSLLWAQVTRTETCWVFTGTRNRKGYGCYSVGGRNVLAHRLAWEMTHGPIPHGLWVLHRCDNPPCVRPDHLFLGTNWDNVDDMVDKGRQFSERRTRRAARGERNASAKLTPAQVVELRALAAETGATHGALAATYGVARRTISEIVQGTRWRHLPIREPADAA